MYTHRTDGYVRCDTGRPGRLTLPKEVRERYGDHYHIVQLHDGIKLIPVADDPLDALREEFAGVEKTADELREAAREEALDEPRR